MSDDVMIYQFIEELKAENKELRAKLLLAEKRLSDASWERDYLQAQVVDNTHTWK